MKIRIFLLLASLIVISLIISCSDTESDTAELVQIFVAAKDDPAVNEVYATFSDTSVVKLSGDLTFSGTVADAAISPDKNYIAFIVDKITDGVFELFVVPVTGGDVIKISGALVLQGNVEFDVSQSVSGIQWSPDSTRIAYAADQDVRNVTEVYVSAIDGSSNVKVSGPIVATSTGVVLNTVSWSPDGMFISYVAEQDAVGVQEVYVSTPDGLSNTKVSGVMVVGQADADVKWAPDSSKLFYIADQDLAEKELYVSTPDGLTNTSVSGTIVVGGGVTRAEWSPDSSLIAYTAIKDTVAVREVYVSTPDGLDVKKVSGTMVSGGTVDINSPDVHWSADGLKLAYLAFQDNNGQMEAYFSTPDGLVNTKINGSMNLGGSVDKFEWAPDSLSITYSATQDSLNRHDLYISTLNSVTDISNLIITGDTPVNSVPTNIVWSPDQSRIGYVLKNPEDEVFLVVVDVAAATSTAVSDNLIYPNANPQTFNLPDLGQAFLWTEDSSRLIYMAQDDDVNVTELFSTDFLITDKLSGRMVSGGNARTFY